MRNGKNIFFFWKYFIDVTEQSCQRQFDIDAWTVFIERIWPNLTSQMLNFVILMDTRRTPNDY